MALNDLLAGGENQGNTPKKDTKKIPKKVMESEVQHSFTLRHDVSTKILLDKIKRIKELTTPNAKSISQGSIVREALELLSINMDFKKFEKKYADFLMHINEESILNK